MRLEFPKSVKEAADKRCAGRCEICGELLTPASGKHFDHIIPDATRSENGVSNALDNCQVLCKSCHKAKTKDDVKAIAKSNRVRAAHAGIKKRSGFRGWRKFNGEPVWK